MPKFDVISPKIANFCLRLMSALILAPLCLLVVYWGGWSYPLVVSIIVMLGLCEWARLTHPDTTSGVVYISYLSLLLIMLVGSYYSIAWAASIACILMGILLALESREKLPDPFSRWLAFGLPYMAGCGLSLLFLRQIPEQGRSWVYYLLAVVWGTDIGAYVVGRCVGGPKLAPYISPGKTWAGLGGGVALATVFGCVAGEYLGMENPIRLAVLAVILALVSQVGDLFESYVKRRSGVKESGGIIPGHGGILDRIDGLVFAAIFLALFRFAAGHNFGL